MPLLSDQLRLAGIITLLLLVNVLNFADRFLISIMQETIKAEFSLSDFQLGLLGGPAFALLYSVLTLPIARLAERRNRISIVSVAIAAWSGMTAMCGFAQSYVGLLACRVGVSVGEAGAIAPALSFISDRFPPHRRGIAISLFTAGASIGTLVASFIGGALARTYGWRTGFLVFGLFGLGLAVLVKICIRETRTAAAKPDKEPIAAALRRISKRRSFVHICLAGIFGTFSGAFILQYMVSFLIRVHDLPLDRAAAMIGLSVGLAGATGMVFAGWLSDRLERHIASARLLVGAASLCVSSASYAAAFWLPTFPALVLLMVGGLAQAAFPAICFSAAASVAPNGTRATTLAIWSFCVNIFGFALGPPIFGAISDFVTNIQLSAQGLSSSACLQMVQDARCSIAQGDGLRIALTVAAFTLLGGVWHFWRARHFYVADLASVDVADVRESQVSLAVD